MQALPIAKTLTQEKRKSIAISSLSKTESISGLSASEGISRKYIYRQKHKAKEALDEKFSDKNDDDVLFNLPVSKSWLKQLMISLVLTCHSSYGGVKELLRDVFDISMSRSTIHNRLQEAAKQAAGINRAQDFSAIRDGLLDEIFQGSTPVLAGVDAASTFCYLLECAERRDGDTWAINLLYAKDQGLAPERFIVDAGTGLRAGHKEVYDDTPCHGDVFHIQHTCETLANLLSRVGKGTVTQRKKLEAKIQAAKDKGVLEALFAQWKTALQTQGQAVQLARDVKTLVQWLSHDILALAGPDLDQRQMLFDFAVAELLQREPLDADRIRPVRVALENQRDDLLGFAGVLDQKLATIAMNFKVSLDLVRDVCLLQRKSPACAAYWQRCGQLSAKFAGKFQGVLDTVVDAMKRTPRASSLVENLNSRLRNYFFLRKQLNSSYLGLLQFFLNHRTFSRSEIPERIGKSPKRLLTGQSHPHWLELLGFTLFKRA
ncbi:hypothetical protein RCH09_003821 [Actimicrobium sp. GrIS 1.19]|uniref:hypothetical protein n=1 Tax=Actimicrobium sp. GrIS 1.19 TaxID=3071708 RepID=UPI002DFA3230|nr:hypothetical protein [Actimicrobium sp. GrIS 1.19]